MKQIPKLIYFFCLGLLGFIFFTSGMAKLYVEHRFFGFIGPVWLETELAKHHLGLLARFVAYTQVVIGYLLLTYRFRFIGFLVLMPMLINILVIVIALNWTGTPYVVTVLLLQNVYLLWYDRNQYLHLITGKIENIIATTPLTVKGNLFWLLGLGLVLLSIQLSFVQIQTAWFLAVLSIGVGVFSNKM
jgi:hypothetical protein